MNNSFYEKYQKKKIEIEQIATLSVIESSCWDENFDEIRCSLSIVIEKLLDHKNEVFGIDVSDWTCRSKSY